MQIYLHFFLQARGIGACLFRLLLARLFRLLLAASAPSLPVVIT